MTDDEPRFVDLVELRKMLEQKTHRISAKVHLTMGIVVRGTKLYKPGPDVNWPGVLLRECATEREAELLARRILLGEDRV